MAENNAYGIKEKILVLREADKTALAIVRCIPGLRVALDKGKIWVRGVPVTENTDKAILQLPVLHTYLLDEQSRLFPAGGLTPVARLDALSWQSLQEFVPIELPVSALPGMATQVLQLKLVHAMQEREVDALMTSLETWKNYGANAPLIRLQQLRFAVSEDARALIMGTPLPPIPGRGYTLHDHILLPAGYSLDPSSMSSVINRRLNPHGDAYLLIDTDSWQRIPLHYCMPATRSAIRMTKGRCDV